MALADRTAAPIEAASKHTVCTCLKRRFKRLHSKELYFCDAMSMVMSGTFEIDMIQTSTLGIGYRGQNIARAASAQSPALNRTERQIASKAVLLGG
jgi:hypothetical protein